MYFHRKAITTGLRTAGAKNSTRSTLRLLIRVCTASARARPIAFCTMTTNAVSLIVLTSDPKDWSSRNSVLKFSSPIHLAPPMPDQSVNA
jgi:hypothetical protein